MCMYVCMGMHEHMLVCAYGCTYKYIYVCAGYMCIHVSMHILYICMYVCTYVYMCACISMYMYAYKHVFVCVYIYCLHAFMCICMYVCESACVCMFILYVCMCVCICTYVCMNVYMCVWVFAFVTLQYQLSIILWMEIFKLSMSQYPLQIQASQNIKIKMCWVKLSKLAMT